MIEYATRVGDLKTLVASIADSGVVHDRSRFVDDWGKYILLFVPKTAPKRVNGWEISRRRVSDESFPELRETWVLRKLMGFQDAANTEHLFQAQLDAALRKFRDVQAIGAPAWGAPAQGALKIDDVDVRMFGDVLCHYAECELETVMYTDAL